MHLRLMMLAALLALPATTAGPSGEDAWLSADKAVYRAGDLMTVRFHNAGDETVFFATPAPWEIRDATGTLTLHSPGPQPTLGVEVRPGGTYNMTWDLQTARDRSLLGWDGELPPGDYRFVVLFQPGSRVGPYEAAREESVPFRACTAPREGPEGAADRLFLARRCA